MLATIMNGKPTEREVRMLLDWMMQHVNTPGYVFPHEEIESYIKHQRDTARYRTVIGVAIRKLFRQTGVKLRSVRGTGYEVPAGRGQLDMGINGCRRNMRSCARNVGIIAAVDDRRLENDKDRQARDSMVSTANYLVEIGRLKVKELGLELGKVLPRLPGGKR